jgi:hypothetical protein
MSVSTAKIVPEVVLEFPEATRIFENWESTIVAAGVNR